MKQGKTELHVVEEPNYKYSITGKKLLVDEAGTWIRKSANWKPHEVPDEWWQKAPNLHDTWRKMYPDTRKMPVQPSGAQPTPDDVQPEVVVDDVGIAEGDTAGTTEAPKATLANYWEETEKEWIFQRNKPAKGLVMPTNDGPGPITYNLLGTRRTEATFADETMLLVEDWYSVPRATVDPDVRAMLHKLRARPWTGATYFEKLPTSTAASSARAAVYEQAGSAGSDSAKRLVALTPARLITDNVGAGGRIGIVRRRLAQHENQEDKFMSDNLVQPCLQESDDWPKMQLEIERQRSQIEEISWFEREVTARQAYVVKNGRKTSGDTVTEAACLAGLAAHDLSLIHI